MFESITFRNQKHEDNRPIDIGMLLECMMFYQNTKVVADRSILRQLLKEIGVDSLVELIEIGLLEIFYTESFVGIRTKKGVFNIEFHDPVIFSSPQHQFQDIIREECIELTGKEGKGRRIARKIEGYVNVINHNSDVVKGGEKILLDQKYLSVAIPLVLKRLLPNLKIDSDLLFSTEKTPQGIMLYTNIDFGKLNNLCQEKVPGGPVSISPARLLSHIYNAECDLYFASTLLTEIATNDISSGLMVERLKYLVDKSNKSQKDIKQFKEFVFADGKMLREAVNTKNVEIKDVVKVLLKSSKFKQWLKNQSANGDLLKEYYKAVTKDSFLDKLPSKMSRWIIFTGLGMIADVLGASGLGTASGLSLSATDTFLLDRLIRGWNPSQFIDQKVKKL